MSNFKYNYVPVEDLEPKSVLLEPGKGEFIVKSFYDKDKDGLPSKTQTGVPKITLVLQVIDSRHTRGTIFDVFTANTAWKFHQLAEAIGTPYLYNAEGNINLERVVGMRGECLIKTEQRPGYDAKSVIERYIASIKNTDAVQTTKVHSNIEEDDDIPF